MSISHLAEINEKAQIGNNVSIGPYAIIDADVHIADNCKIHPHANIMNGTRIAEGTSIYQGAIVGSEPQDLKYKGEQTLLNIGKNVSIREYCTINKGTAASGQTEIGDDALIMAYVHVAHDCQIGRHAIIANSVNLAGHVQVDDYAIIGGMTAVQQFVHIGESCFIGGGTLVRKDVPPFIKVAREPLSYVGVNSVGLRRRGFTVEAINKIKDVYRILFVKYKNISLALEEIDANLPESDEKYAIVSFIHNSSQGLVRGFRQHRGHDY
jgi:UDP-N-acetylglucosamine acyltransferase